MPTARYGCPMNIILKGQDAFDTALAEIDADWTPGPEDYADLDRAAVDAAADYAASFGDFMEDTFDPDRGW